MTSPRDKKYSKVVGLTLLAAMSLALTGCNEKAKQQRAQECLSGLRDRASEKCKAALAAYPGGYATPLRSGFYGGGYYGWWGHGSSTSGAAESDGSVARGGFGDAASAHGGEAGGGHGGGE